ncbi:MAG: SCP2 sterol-binding domain-containing protein [Actinobacteria bacterium]|nr:SCP2 sterol-binding domain-containing protein [Actinomycetota bacterium]MBU1943607.1 SCP2 sterol-binding domain-containing protein [Actinomycetota bacterium]MBU2688940.1 SCP2 sterol-binding domain-containing protein [Actinomycetota bacterium]
MSVYGDSEAAGKFFEEFWNELLENPEVRSTLEGKGLSVRFKINDPDLDMYIDEQGIRSGAEAGTMSPVLTLAMSGDVIHLFWLRKLNVAKALATRQVRTRGPVPKFMKLLPAVEPGYVLYRDYCERYGLPTEV